MRSASQDRESCHDFSINPSAVGMRVSPGIIVKVDAVKGCDDDGEEELESAAGAAGVEAADAGGVPVLVYHGDRDRSAFRVVEPREGIRF